MGDLAFAHPWVLLGLILLPAYGLLRLRAQKRDRIPYPPLQYRQAAKTWRLPFYPLVQVELLLLTLLVVGTSGPFIRTELELIEDEGVDVVLALDISLSMLAEDFPPNRLEALRDLARGFIARAGSHRVGLVVFARDAYVQVPLTTDHRVLLELLDGVTVRILDQNLSGGTAVGDALLVAGSHLERSKLEGRDQALILITDGESNMGTEPELAARFLKHLGVRFYAVGIGGEEPVEVFFDGERLGGDTPYLAYLDDQQLKRMTAAASGLYYRATDVGALEAIFAELSRLEGAPLEIRTQEIRHHLGRYLALAALPILTLSLLLGGVLMRRPLR